MASYVPYSSEMRFPRRALSAFAFFYRCIIKCNPTYQPTNTRDDNTELNTITVLAKVKKNRMINDDSYGNDNKFRSPRIIEKAFALVPS